MEFLNNQCKTHTNAKRFVFPNRYGWGVQRRSTSTQNIKTTNELMVFSSSPLVSFDDNFHLVVSLLFPIERLLSRNTLLPIMRQNIYIQTLHIQNIHSTTLHTTCYQYPMLLWHMQISTGRIKHSFSSPNDRSCQLFTDCRETGYCLNGLICCDIDGSCVTDEKLCGEEHWAFTSGAGHLTYIRRIIDNRIYRATASNERCAANHSNWRCMAVGFAASLLTTYTVDLNVNRADGGIYSVVEKCSLSLDCKRVIPMGWSLWPPLIKRVPAWHSACHSCGIWSGRQMT